MKPKLDAVARRIYRAQVQVKPLLARATGHLESIVGQECGRVETPIEVWTVLEMALEDVRTAQAKLEAVP